MRFFIPGFHCQMENNKNPKGGRAKRAAPLGRRRRRRLVVFHLVRISYVSTSFPEFVLARFSTKFADSENFLPQGACSPNIACNMGSWRRSNKISMEVGWWVCRSPLPVFSHTFCTLGAFRLRETSYRELKPCKLQWFLHLRMGPPAKTIGNRSEKLPKTKQNKMRPLARLLSYPSHA